MSEEVECPECSDEFIQIGHHWAAPSGCEHPELTEHQREIAIGLLMGDGYLCRDSKNSRLQVNMVTEDYLNHLDEEFDILGTGVRLHTTAEEGAKDARKSGFSPDAQAEDYSNIYRWNSRRHPELNEFTEWYSTDKKVWPENIDLTPTVLKHWFCGDGNFDNSNSVDNISIAMSNEIDNTEKIDRIFERAGLPTPSNYKVWERNDGSLKCDAQFTAKQSQELWEYMGEPLPDFEYKWPEKYR